MSENIYIKSKTSVSNLENVKGYKPSENSFKVGVVDPDILINYVTNLYADPEIAIVRELFTNACDASVGTDNPIKIEILRDKKSENRWSFSITDLGCGMSKKELEDNYITYANSSKQEDFEQVGSFGLGSKSPMALVSSYTVISNNGEEENKFVVNRTDKGIYADVVETDHCSDFSFTKVMFTGLSYASASTMAFYINNYVIPFSKHSVVLNYEGTPREDMHFSDPKEFEYVIELPSVNGFDLTIYTNEQKKSVCRYFKSGTIQCLVRLNNIVYKLDSSDYENPIDDCVVIDIDPGYFAFAPSRETLPKGAKLDHIVDILQTHHNEFLEKHDEFIKFSLDKNIFTSDELVIAEKVNAYNKIEDVACFNISKKKQDEILAFRNRINSVEELDPQTDIEDEFDKHEFAMYLNSPRNKYSHTRKRKLLDAYDFVQLVHRTYKNFQDTISNPYLKTCQHHGMYSSSVQQYLKVDIINNVKFTRTDKARLSVHYNATSERYLNQSRDVYSQLQTNMRHACHTVNCAKYLEVFVKEGCQLPENILNLLKYVNCSKFDDQSYYLESDDNIDVHEMVYPKRAEVAKQPPILDKQFTCTINNPKDKTIDRRLISYNGITEMSKNEDIIVIDVNYAGYGFNNFVAFITGKKVVSVSKNFKRGMKHLDKNDVDYIEAKVINQEDYYTFSAFGDEIKNVALSSGAEKLRELILKNSWIKDQIHEHCNNNGTISFSIECSNIVKNLMNRRDNAADKIAAYIVLKHGALEEFVNEDCININYFKTKQAEKAVNYLDHISCNNFKHYSLDCFGKYRDWGTGVEDFKDDNGRRLINLMLKKVDFEKYWKKNHIAHMLDNLESHDCSFSRDKFESTKNIKTLRGKKYFFNDNDQHSWRNINDELELAEKMVTDKLRTSYPQSYINQYSEFVDGFKKVSNTSHCKTRHWWNQIDILETLAKDELTSFDNKMIAEINKEKNSHKKNVNNFLNKFVKSE